MLGEGAQGRSPSRLLGNLCRFGATGFAVKVLAGLPRRSSPKASEVWRRRESNPRPRVNPRETLHAYPLLFSRTRREEAAQNRQAPDPVNLAVRRRAAV
jgi:hypothetical protein